MAVRNVKSGEDLQAVILAASLGDEIVVEPSGYGPIRLPNLPGTGTLTIRSSAMEAMGPPDHIVRPDTQGLVGIISPGKTVNAITTQPGAHDIVLRGFDVRPADKDAFLYDLVLLGDATAAQNTLDLVPRRLMLDKSYIHAFEDAPLKRGVALNSAETTIQNSWLSGFKVVGQDAQAIAGWNGPGPFTLINNYIEGAGENLIFGGDAASIPGLIPSDILIRACLFSKPLNWNTRDPSYVAGNHWDCKNLLEFKNAQRVVVDGCIFENNWVDAQSGSAILFTPRGAGNQVKDITLSNNILRNSAAGFQFLGSDDYSNSGRTTGIKIKNNFLQGVANRNALLGSVGGPPRAFSFVPGPAGGSIDVEITHNTILDVAELIYGQGDNPGLIFNDNLVGFTEYGILGLGKFGKVCLDTYFPGWRMLGNVLVAKQDGTYPDGNTFVSDWAAVKMNGMALASDSPFVGKASDGTDVGVNATLLPGGQPVVVAKPGIGRLELGGIQTIAVHDVNGALLFQYP